MKFTNLVVVKKGQNEFLIEVVVYSQLAGTLICKRKWGYFAISIKEAQDVLSSFPNRECQRFGSSARCANRFRATRLGDLCFTVRWDGGCDSFPDMGVFHDHVVMGTPVAETIYPGYLHIDRISSSEWKRRVQWDISPINFTELDFEQGGEDGETHLERGDSRAQGTYRFIDLDQYISELLRKTGKLGGEHGQGGAS